MIGVIDHCKDSLASNDSASIGVGALIIFIAMILVAGVTASVIIQTMNSMQQQALKTGQETIRDVSSGLRVSHVSGYVSNSTIDQLVFFVEVVAGSEAIDLSQATVSLSDSQNIAILKYDMTCFNNSLANGLFSTINATNLTSEEFGILSIRDSDNSCSNSTPIINKNDLVAILINTTNCFGGLDESSTVSGRIIPEQGMSGVIAFTTPSFYVDTIIDLA